MATELRAMHAAPPAWTRQGTLLLPIDPGCWPPPAHGLRLDGLDFAAKRELHVTLVGRALGEELQARMAGGPDLCAAITAAAHALDWRLARPGRYCLLRKQTAHSIIERVELPAMAVFRQRLGDLMARTLPVPPPHVTLYTCGDDDGIGVPSGEALCALAVREVERGELPAA
jgi:hypothetical protein